MTVTPSAQYHSPLLYLTNAHVVSAHAWRFRVADAGTGYTNYAVEYRSSLAPTNVLDAGDQRRRLARRRLRGHQRSAAAEPWLLPGQGRGVPADNGRLRFRRSHGRGRRGDGLAPVLVFNGVYSGTVTCIWTDEQGTSWTNQVQVNGTTAVIPLPASYRVTTPPSAN